MAEEGTAPVIPDTPSETKFKYADQTAAETANVEAQRKITEQAEQIKKLQTPAPEPVAVKSLSITPASTSDKFVPLGDVLSNAGFDVEAEFATFNSTGKVSDRANVALMAARPGVSEDAVRREAVGEAAIRQNNQIVQNNIHREAIGIVGTEEQLDSLLSQATGYVPADEMEDLNNRLRSPRTYRGALRDLMQFQKDGLGAGGANPLVPGGGISQTHTGGYPGFTEWDVAMKARTKSRATPEQIRKLDNTDPAVIQSANRPG